MQQTVDLALLRAVMQLEITFEEICHLLHGGLILAALGRDEYGIPRTDLQGDELHEAVHLTALTMRIADEERAAILLAEFPGLLHDHGCHADVDATLVMNHRFALNHHTHKPIFLCAAAESATAIAIHS